MVCLWLPLWDCDAAMVLFAPAVFALILVVFLVVLMEDVEKGGLGVEVGSPVAS